MILSVSMAECESVWEEGNNECRCTHALGECAMQRTSGDAQLFRIEERIWSLR